MENATKRIRKARRQGLAENGKALAPSSRVRFSPGPADIPGTRRANARRKTTMTGRKQQRQGRAKTSRQKT